MEITTLHKDSLKIQGKQATFYVDPQKGDIKTAADAIIHLDKKTAIDTQAQLVIEGPGEYEIKGVKIGAVKNGESVVTNLVLDGIEIAIVEANTGGISKEKGIDSDIAVIYANDVLDASVIAATDASVIILYGPKVQESVKAVGKEENKMSKYTVTKEKLPADTQLISLE